jgi:cytochrome c peroxidase
MGAFKTPTLRHLLGTRPYMHNGGEKTLAEVIEFYDRGGNANEFLDVKMRDIEAEQAYLRARENNQAYKGPEVQLFGPNKKPIVSLKLNLTKKEKEDLVLFVSALQGDRADPIVADRKMRPH